jgi:hypothetical protein
MDLDKDKAELLKEYAPQLPGGPDDYRIYSNGAIVDAKTHRILLPPTTVPVPKDKDTRITSDTNGKHNASKLAHKRWDMHRERIAEQIVSQAIKSGSLPARSDAADAVAVGWGRVFADSLSKDNGKLVDRLRVIESTTRALYPGLLMDSRQRDSSVLEGGGMRLELSEGATAQLASLLRPMIRQETVEGDYREITGDGEADS